MGGRQCPNYLSGRAAQHNGWSLRQSTQRSVLRGADIYKRERDDGIMGDRNPLAILLEKETDGK